MMTPSASMSSVTVRKMKIKAARRGPVGVGASTAMICLIEPGLDAGGDHSRKRTAWESGGCSRQAKPRRGAMVASSIRIRQASIAALASEKTTAIGQLPSAKGSSAISAATTQ